MEDNVNNIPNVIRYPPSSNLPNVLQDSDKIKNDFVKGGAEMLPKLQDFNQMFRLYSESIFNMSETIFPPGHPMFNREHSITTLKEENEKLLKENLDLRKKLDNKSERKNQII